jgi:phospholipase/carboxylesterase
MGDLQGLRRALPRWAAVVTPQAPHPGLPWGYGPGWAWYRYDGGDRADPRSLLESLHGLQDFLAHLPAHLGFRPGSLVLGGFSQGGTTSLAFALLHPGIVDAVVNLSGFLVNQEVLGIGPEALAGTPVFWGHGTQDPAVPHRLAEVGRKRLTAASVPMKAVDYPMGHQVSRQEAEDLTGWLEGTVGGWAIQRPATLRPGPTAEGESGPP